uniref:Uncharacterized protein n=1 Tax=Anopheles stephensi TaxID=30069 RepID=A0A182YBL6_ANOST
MDGTGSTVVIYKTETGERLVLKDVPVPLAVAKSGRLHPTNPSPAQHGSAAAGRVMIIDEQPSVGASFGTVSNNTVDCNTSVTTPAGAETTVNTWAKILLQPPVPCEASVRITNYTDEWDPKYLDVDLRVRRLDQTTAIDFDLDLKQELDNNVEMMYTGKQQLCGKELRRSRNLLDRYIASELVKHSNLTTRCPIKTGHYEVRNFEIDDRHLMMSVVPSGEFLIEVGVYHRGKEIKMNRWFVTAT